MAKASRKKKKVRERKERRFVAQSSQNKMLVAVIGAVGSAALGAGIYGQIWGHFERAEGQWLNPVVAVAAGGALLLAVAIWLGTSADPAVRVGDAGIVLEKGELRRMPWWAIHSITWESGNSALAIVGKDDGGRDLTFRVSAKTNPHAAAWIVKEADLRAEEHIDVPADARERLPEADPHAGMLVQLEPMQVVGRRCAKSGKLIAFEPDARVCPRCERVYFKTKVPKRCACGMMITHLRDAMKGGATPVDEDEDEGDETSGEHEAAEAKEA